MPEAPQTTDSLIGWLKNNVIAVISLTGVFLYIIFSIPATIFYGRLGTTPSEVGFNYSNILSGSTFGVLILIGFAVLIAMLILVLLGYAAVIFVLLPRAKFITTRTDRLNSQDDTTISDDEFDRKLNRIRKTYKNKSGWPETEQALRRKRELAQLENRTAAEDSEIINLNSRYNYGDIFLRSLLPPFSWPSRHWRGLLAAFLFIMFTGTTSLFTLSAYYNADAVKRGVGLPNRLVYFDYRADPVSVKAASPGDTSTIGQVVPANGRVFLLGENSQEVVLYIPNMKSASNGSTVRLPVSEVIISDIP